MIIIIYRCAAGFEESVPNVAACAEVSSDEEADESSDEEADESSDGEADESSDGEADEGSAKAGEKRLCMYLFLIFAYTLIFWAMKRKNII